MAACLVSRQSNWADARLSQARSHGPRGTGSPFRSNLSPRLSRALVSRKRAGAPRPVAPHASLNQRPAGAAVAELAPQFSRESFEELILSLQERICEESARRDGSGQQFIIDRWERGSAGTSGPSSGGYGISRVLEGGSVLEKAAANVTVIRGTLSKPRAQAMSSRQGRSIEAGTEYFAAALSLVFHSAHPLVPTFRSDIRYFEVEGTPGWFGGGADLTPFYVFPEDAGEFHSFYKGICDKHSAGMFAAMKQACDAYFFLPARGEHRGVGGIFFDDLSYLPASPPSPGHSEAPVTPEALSAAFAFVRDVGEGFMASYWPIVERRRGAGFTERERQWQLVRRGRYLEFNLLYDRGVKFGMDGNGRVKSIMVSAPPLISWVYDDDPAPGSREAELVEVLRSPRDWA